MPEQAQNQARRSGLRTRFAPRSRIGQGLVSVAPWVDTVLLALFFVFLNGRVLLQPGIVVELPETPFREGLRPGGVVVVFSVAGAEPGRREEIVFFDDDRYLAGSEEQMRKLKHAFSRQVHARSDATLVIKADRHVRHGTVVAVMNMALEVGIARVNIAASPF